jgi:FixJ family two-component response regulator
MSATPQLTIIETSVSSQQILELLAQSMGMETHVLSAATYPPQVPLGGDLILVSWEAVGPAGNRVVFDCLDSSESIPVIVLAQDADIRLAVNLMKVGAADFIMRPYDLDTVRKSIEEALSDRKRPEVQDSLPQGLCVLLSEEQIEILNRIVRGDSVKRIASDLLCSIRTVHYRKAQAFEILGVKSRRELLFRVHEWTQAEHRQSLLAEHNSTAMPSLCY